MKPGKIKHDHASVRVSYSQAIPVHMRGQVRELSGLVVDSAQRGHGHAKALMQQVMTEADQAGVFLLVIVEPFDDAPMETDALSAWYERMGFVEIQHQPKVMVRPVKH
jgi:ribosomal protein S18 acetylase RimI-like enzyme